MTREVNANRDARKEVHGNQQEDTMNQETSSYQDSNMPVKTHGELVHLLMQNTSIHGVAFIIGAKCSAKRIFWLVISLCAAAAWIYHSQSLIRQYLSYETQTTLDIHRASSVPFPAITICNQNPLKQSHAFGIAELQKDLTNPDDGDFFYNDYAEKYDYDDYYKDGTGSVDGISTDLSPDAKKQILLTEYLAGLSQTDKSFLGHSDTEMLAYCSYAGHFCTNVTFHHIFDWYYGNCYSFNSGVETNLLRATRTGPLSGLKLIINIEQDEYLNMTEKAGVRIVVHSPDQFPFPVDNGFDASPGESTAVGLSLVNITRLSQPHGYCVDTTKSNKLINVFEEVYPWTSYSLLACQKTCYQYNVIKHCGCYDPTLPNIGAALNTTSEDKPEPCSVRDRLHSTCKNKQATLLHANKLQCLKQCQNPCYQRAYSLTLSDSYWPSKKSLPGLVDFLDDSPVFTSIAEGGRESIAENLLELEIYFKELNFEAVTEGPSYSFGQFLSDLGGALGLYLGASLITFFEFAEFAADNINLSCCMKDKKSKQYKQQKQQPEQDGYELKNTNGFNDNDDQFKENV